MNTSRVETDRVGLDALWQPLTIGPTVVRNRVMANATTLLYGERSVISDRHIAYYAERAKGGIGLLVSEQHAVHPLAVGAFARCCQAYDAGAVPQFRKLARAVHRHGAKLFVQLFAPGILDSGSLGIDEWHPLWGASTLPAPGNTEIPIAIGKPELEEIVAGFAESARNVADSGLDGVEIHASHDWLLGQFLSPLWNNRGDRYGGSVENRCRLAVEAARAIRGATSDRITVGIQLSADEYVGDIGITPPDFERQLEVMVATGLFDYFAVSTGGIYSEHWTIPTMEVADAYLAPLAQRAKRIVGDRAHIFLGGQIRDVHSAARLVASGTADMVSMARAHLADPFLVKKAREGREAETIKCVSENECMLRVASSREVVCMMNPATGREWSWGVGLERRVGASERQRVVVIGGGPAGMQCAAAAAKRGHSVVLLEREDELGGQLRTLRSLPGRSRWQEAIDSLRSSMDAAGAAARVGIQSSIETVDAEAPGIVICATGATWDRTGYSPGRPERKAVEGTAQDHVLDIGTAARRAIADPGSLGGRVVIVDETGDYLPVGLGDLLSRNGVAVEIVTRHAVVGRHLYGSLDAPFIFPRLVAAGVTFTPHHFLDRVGGDDVSLVDVWGVRHRTIAAECVVLSMLRSPDHTVSHRLRSRYPDVRSVGDCLTPRRLPEVIYEGERVGREL